MLRNYLKVNLIQLCAINPSNSFQIVNQLEEYNDNLTKMTLYLSLCSISCNIAVGLGYIMASYNDLEYLSWMRLLIFFANLFGIIKYLSNFFLFYYFNINFRSSIQCFQSENSVSN